MKKISLLVFPAFQRLSGSYGQQPKCPVDYVDPFIGSQGGEVGSLFTPARRSIRGSSKLAPMTYGFNGYYGGGGQSGYNYQDSSIIGFAHVHEWQTGGILIMPTTGNLVTVSRGSHQRRFRIPEVHSGKSMKKLPQVTIRFCWTSTTSLSN